MQRVPMSGSSWRMVAGVVAIAFMSLPALAQHAGDVHFEFDDGRIEIEFDNPIGPVFEGNFPTEGPFARFTTNPGFETHHDEPITPGAAIDYNIVPSALGYLVFWSAATESFESTLATITIGNNPSGDTVIAMLDVNRTGGLIGQADNDGDLHVHVDFTLSEGAAFGAYGFLMELTTDVEGIANSEPFWLVFNYGLDHEVFDDVVLPAFVAIPEPTSFALLGLGGMMLLRRRSRALAH